MSSLKVWKDTGVLLFDTDKISYGLLKSGYLILQEAWTRRLLRSSNVDPNDGANWIASAVVVAGSTSSYNDNIYTFTVTNGVSPIVFLTGRGCLSGVTRSGSTFTFYYVNVEPNTKAYCFDLMRDTAGSPYLKTYTSDGVLSFNSLMTPLNVAMAIQAPPPQGDQSIKYPPDSTFKAYVNGYYIYQQTSPTNQLTCRVDIPISSGTEYAAHLPWSRGCKFLGTDSRFVEYNGVEGCAGYNGGIQFQFGPSAATPQAFPSYGVGAPRPPPIYQVPTDRYPTALVIKTSTYPFPFN